MRVFLASGLLLGAPRAIIALPLAYTVARSMSALLFGVPPTDAPVYAGAAGVAVMVSLAATLAPALRVSRVDPSRWLRAE